MKTKFASLLVVLFITTTIQLSAQRRITVEAVNNDISYSLDLKAVASIFGDARTLEDFERRLNDYDAQISNLDLNSDGEIDYLRVIETSENNLHLVVIQAILDRDVFQDVATIVVERDRYNRTYVQVIGDPYMYGYNYIIEPVYLRTPRLFSWFWTPRYQPWNSPYYWGYYPRHYHHRRPIEINLYLTHINHHINHRHNYRYSENIRNEQAYRLRNSVSRNDYGVRYPERNFSKRNSDVKNRYEIDRRSNNGSRGNNNIDKKDNRSINNNRNNSNNRSYDNAGRNNTNVRTERGTRNENNRINSNSEVNNRSNREEKAASTRNSNTERYNRNSDSNNSGSVNRSSSSRENREQQKASRNEERPAKVSRELNRKNERSVEATRPARENKSESRSERRSNNNEKRSNSDSNNNSRR